MGYIVIDRSDGSDDIRHQMRRSMRSDMYRHEGYSPMMRGHEHDGGYEHGYRVGYKHGWEDNEDDMNDAEYRRQRDARGRYI